MTADRRKAYVYFVQQGWTREQSAGIVANLIAESGLRPDAVGDGGKAYGIAQWHPPRQAGFSALIGKPIQGSSLDDQLAWVHAELRGTEKAAGDALSTCITPGAAAACVSRLYERPADREGEASRRAELAESIFQELVGVDIADEAEIAPEAPKTPIPPVSPPQGVSMGPLMFLPAILQLIPSLTALFAKGERGQTNAQAAQIVVDAFTRAVPGASNTQDALEKAIASPSVAAQAKSAVMSDPNVLGLIEVGGGIKEARAADLAWASAPKPFYKSSPVFWISIVLLPLVYWLVGSLIVGGTTVPTEWPVWAQLPLKLFGGVWNGESRSGGFNLVIGLILGGICGVYYGVSVTQNNQRRGTDQPPNNV